jgi:hypothetical protein
MATCAICSWAAGHQPSYTTEQFPQVINWIRMLEATRPMGMHTAVNMVSVDPLLHIARLPLVFERVTQPDPVRLHPALVTGATTLVAVEKSLRGGVIKF